MTDLNLNLGIDFGTSFTKVCVRDTDRDCSWLVTFSDGRSVLDEALVPTKLAICSDGQLLAGLTQSEWQKQTNTIQVAVDFVKMRLAHIDLRSEWQKEEWQKEPLDYLPNFQGIDLNAPESIENICAYYLSSIILKAKSWIIRNNTDLVKNQTISWSANVGVPVKYCDSKAIDRFKKVLRFAFFLSENHPQSFEELWQRMEQLRNQLPHEEEDIPCFAIPEIAAAVYSYTVSRSAEPGTYIFFDVGSGTIEGASFRFWRENAMPKIDFYSGEVEPLGVNALSKRITTLSEVTENELENGLIHYSQLLLEQIYSLSASIARSLQRGEYVANKVRVSVEGVKYHLQKAQDIQSQKLLHLIWAQHLIHRQVAQTIWSCKEKNPEHFKKASSLIVFLGGGGKNSEYYRDTIESTYTAFSHQYAGIPIYKLREVPSPSKRGTEVEDFDMSGINHSDFHRFAIAYGLSIPDYEAPKVNLPRQFPVVPPRPYQPTNPEIGRYPDDHTSM